MMPPSMARIEGALARYGLAVTGAFHPGEGDRAPAGVATLLLIGARNGAMWRNFTGSPEYTDGKPEPLDRWSRRVLETVAAANGARALFPFGGPPYLPFQHWAARGEGAVASPVGMQVSPSRGLWMSYRGALGLPDRIPLGAPPAASPCIACPAPCRSACPVDAFAGGSYDVARCVAHVTSAAGAPCRAGGCLVRQACPADKGHAPPASQSRFHMDAFIRARQADPRRAE